MKVPDFKLRLVRIICAGCTALAATVLAESPENGSNKNPGSRSRPQVIYHLPPASNYGATLHSQAKGQNRELPVDNSKATSRANPNAPITQEPQTTTPPPQERHISTKVQSNRSSVRQRSTINSSGRGNRHGNKSHKR